MKKVVTITAFILCMVQWLPAQVFTILDTIPCNHCYEIRVKDSIRTTAGRNTLSFANFNNNVGMGGTGYSRHGGCLHNESRYVAMEELSNGSYVGIFQYNESCAPHAVVIIIMDSTGDLVSEYYLEDNTYDAGASIIDDLGVFHAYVQLSAGANLFEIRHLTFDYSGVLVDSNSIVQGRNLYGGGAYRTNRYINVGDSILISYWDYPFNANSGLALYDKDLQSHRVIIDELGFGYSSVYVKNDTITMLTGSRNDAGELQGGLSQINIRGNYIKRNLSRSFPAKDFIQLGNYYIVSEYSTTSWYHNDLVVYNKNLDIIHKEEIHTSGRFTAISENSFLLYNPGQSATNYVIEVNLDSLRALDPLVGVEEEIRTKVGYTLYPNPTSSTLNFSFEQTQETTIHVYSLTGALLLERQVNTQNEQLDVSCLPEGMYVVQVSTAQGIESQKVVISR